MTIEHDAKEAGPDPETLPAKQKCIVEDDNNNILSLRCPKCQSREITADVYGIAELAPGSCSIGEPGVSSGGLVLCRECGYGRDDIPIREFVDEVIFDTGLEVLPGTITSFDSNLYDCKGVCGEMHTGDEVILKANKDLLSALSFLPETEHSVCGAVLHALDELQLLGVEGFVHPEDGD